MKILLDTNICIYLIKNNPPEVREQFEVFVPGDIGISSITVAELRYPASLYQGCRGRASG